jgi:hypothetical protein
MSLPEAKHPKKQKKNGLQKERYEFANLFEPFFLPHSFGLTRTGFVVQ